MDDGQVDCSRLHQLQRDIGLRLGDSHVDLGELGAGSDEHGNEQRRDGRGERGDPNHAVSVAVQPIEIGACREDLGEDGLGMCDEASSRLGQLDPAPLSDEQLAVRLPLQHRKLL